MSIWGNPIMMGGGGGGTPAVGLFDGPFLESTSGSGWFYDSTTGTTRNIVQEGILGESAIGKKVIIGITKSTSDITPIPVSDLTRIYTSERLDIYYGALTSTTTISITQAIMVSAVVISDKYSPLVFEDLCGYIPANSGTAIDTERLKTAFAFKVSVKFPNYPGMFFITTSYDYVDSSYLPTVWQYLNFFTPQQETLIRRTSGSNLSTGSCLLLKHNNESYNQYLVRGSVAGHTDDGTLKNPSALTSIAAVNQFNDIPSWDTISLGTAYLYIAPTENRAAIVKSGSGATSVSFTTNSNGSYKLFVIALNSEASTYDLNISATQNGTAITGESLAYHAYESSGTNRRNYRIMRFDVDVTSGDSFGVSLSSYSGYTSVLYALVDTAYDTIDAAATTADAVCTGTNTNSGMVLYGTFNSSSGGTINAENYTAGSTVTTDDPGSNYKSAYIFWFV